MTAPVQPKPKKRRDPLLDAADALDAGHLTHDQLVAMNTPEKVAQGYRQDTDLGTLAAAGLGAARGASFGLGDLAQKLALNPTDQAAVANTASQHPYATTAGTIAGAALPFLLAPAATGAQVGRGAGVAIGAAQGAGLTQGSVGDRLLGAGLGAGLAFGAPYIARGAAAAGSRLPLIGGLVQRLRGVQSGFPAALKETPSMTPAAAAQLGARIARPLGGPLEDIAAAQADLAAGKITQEEFNTAMELAGKQMAGGVSQEPLLPSLRAAADPMETIPAFARNPTPGGPAEGLLPWYPRGGATQQYLIPRPTLSPTMAPSGLPLAQLKLLMQLPSEQFESAASMFPKEVVDQLRALRLSQLAAVP